MAQNVIASYIGINGKAYKFTRGSVVPEVGFADGTDDDISAMIEGHYNGKIDIADYWSVGDVRQASDSKPLFQVSAHTSLRTYVYPNANSFGGAYQSTASIVKQTEIKWQIIGIKHDTLTTNINGYNKAAITIQTVGILGNAANCTTSDYSKFRWMSMNDSHTNINSWKGCQMRKYLTGWASSTTLNSDGSGNFYKACNFKSLIKKVNKSTNTGNSSNSNTSLETTNDYVFLLSEWEVFGTKTYSVGDEGCTQYTYWANHNTNSDRVKKCGWEGASGNVLNWWERSPRSGYSSAFCLVYNSGSAASDGSSYYYGVTPAACL